MELVNGKFLEVFLGDITKDTSDVIVNAANGQLIHGAGVAAKIAKKAGNALDNGSASFSFFHTKSL